MDGDWLVFHLGCGGQLVGSDSQDERYECNECGQVFTQAEYEEIVREAGDGGSVIRA